MIDKSWLAKFSKINFNTTDFRIFLSLLYLSMDEVGFTPGSGCVTYADAAWKNKSTHSSN